jgi:GntR family transcriptional regulator
VSTSAQPDFVPRYYTIEQLQPHDALPSESELSREFHVSRMTARAAVMRLVTAGLVYRESGRGTFVAAPKPSRRADRLLSFSEEMRRQGRVASSRVVTAQLRPATEEEADRLRLIRPSDVVAIMRVRLGDGIPIAVERSVLPPTLAALLERDLAAGSLHEAIDELGYVPTAGDACVSASTATGFEADLLGLAPGHALLVEQRLILDQHGDALESTESRYVGDRYTLAVTFDVQRQP